MNPTIITLLLCIISSLSLPKFNTTLASRLAYMSMIAYSDSKDIKRWSCQHCCKDLQLQSIRIINHKAGGIQAFAGYSKNDKAIILSFRGSNNIQNWITNLQFLSTNYDKCQQCLVHLGFYTGINLIKVSMIQALQQLRQLHNCNKIFITGHSLGGAFATLAAAEIHEAMQQITLGQLITFGRPRVGNRNFGKYISSLITSWRVVHFADIVVQLPPLNVFYVHQGYEVWYTRDMTDYSICKGDTNKCQRSLRPTQFRRQDHRMKSYLKLQPSDGDRSRCVLKKNNKKYRLKKNNRS